MWNFGRVVMLHREIVELPELSRGQDAEVALPLRGLWRAMFKGQALLPVLPSATRAFALRLYRASLYAETV